MKAAAWILGGILLLAWAIASRQSTKPTVDSDTVLVGRVEKLIVEKLADFEELTTKHGKFIRLDGVGSKRANHPGRLVERLTFTRHAVFERGSVGLDVMVVAARDPANVTAPLAITEMSSEGGGYRVGAIAGPDAKLFAGAATNRSAVLSKDSPPGLWQREPEDALLSPAGDMVAVLFRGGFEIWQVQPPRRLGGQNPEFGMPRAAMWAPDQSHLAIVCGNQSVSLWTAPEARLAGRVQHVFQHDRRFHPLALTRDATVLYLGALLAEAEAWRMPAGMQSLRIGETSRNRSDRVSYISVAPSGEWLAAVFERTGGAHLWHLPAGRLAGEFSVGYHEGCAAAFSPDRTKLFLAVRASNSMKVR